MFVLFCAVAFLFVAVVSFAVLLYAAERRDGFAALGSFLGLVLAAAIYSFGHAEVRANEKRAACDAAIEVVKSATEPMTDAEFEALSDYAHEACD